MVASGKKLLYACKMWWEVAASRYGGSNDQGDFSENRLIQRDKKYFGDRVLLLEASKFIGGLSRPAVRDTVFFATTWYAQSTHPT